MATGIGGEVGWWCPSLDDAGNGTTTLNDLSGNANDGTLTNMDAATDWVADTNNGGIRALDFDGTNDHVTVPYTNNYNYTSDFTISYWMKISSVSQFDVFISFGVFNSYGWYTQVRDSSDPYDIAFAANLPNSEIITGTSALSGNWHHIFISIASSQPKIYVDDVLVATGTGYTAPVANASAPLTFAQYTGGGLNPNVRMDDIRLFDSVISATDRASLASQRGYQPSGRRSPMQSHILGGYSGPLRGII